MKTTVRKLVTLFVIIGLFSFPQFSMVGSIAVAADADTIAPYRDGYSPTQDFPVGDNITITFNEPVKKAENFSQISLVESTSTLIPLSESNMWFSADNKTLSVNPPDDLKIGTDYVLTLPANSVMDFSDNRNTSAIIHSFRTQGQSNGGNNSGDSGNRPTVTSLNPSSGETGVSKGSNIRVTFDKAIQKDSGFDNIKVENPNAASIDIETSISDNVLIIDPFLDMRRGGKYTVTIPSGAVKDSNGNSNVAYSYSFNVSSSSSTGPVIVQTTPRNGETDIDPDTDIIIKYDVSFDRGSNYNSIALKDPNGNSIPMNLGTRSNNSLVINPSHNLPGLVTYTVNIPESALKDSSNNYSENAYTFKFKVDEDDDAPDAPSNLSASNTSSSTVVQLNWKSNSEADVDGYYVYRKLKTANNYTKLNTSLVTTNSYKDTGVQAGQVYSYYVTAYDKSENESNKSIAVEITAGSVSVLGATANGDVSPNAWYASYVSKLQSKQVMGGYPDGTFRPEGSITRAEFCKALVIAMGWTASSPLNGTFSDIPSGSWSYAFVETAYAKGFIKGYPTGEFRPNNMVTRAEMAQMIALALKLQSSASSYPDTSDHWAKLYIGACSNAGIVDGYADNTFKPNGFATRAEASKMLVITMDKK
jgi:hypothetical protein